MSSVLYPTTSTLTPTFDVFIDQLPNHITVLLIFILWYHNNDFDLCDHAANLFDILLVNNGGLTHTMGSYGLVEGATSGTRLMAGSQKIGFLCKDTTLWGHSCGVFKLVVLLERLDNTW